MTAPAPVVALAAQPGTGKSELAMALVGLHGWVRIAFADALKVGVAAMLGMPREALDRLDVKNSPAYEGCPLTVRDVLEYAGHALTAHHPTFWVDLMLPIVKQRASMAWVPGVVIDDLRFPWEADAIAALPEGYVIGLHRDAAPAPDPRLPSYRFIEAVMADPRTKHVRLAEGREGTTRLADSIAAMEDIPLSTLPGLFSFTR